MISKYAVEKRRASNITKIINSHNKSVASKQDKANQILCNCRNPDNEKHDNKCLTSKTVYSAHIITDNQQPSKVYLRINEREVFRHRQNEIDTSTSGS